MPFNIDITIFIGFLVVNLVLGLVASRGVEGITGYAVGNRNFSTATIVATIVATWVSGEYFYSNISETYNKGLNAIWIATGDILYLFFIGLFFAPRMGEFLGKLSIADAMGSLFGQKVRIITAVAGFIGAAGLIAIQLKMAGFVFEWALGIPSIYGVISATIIVTVYSSLGGIKSVTFTDVIQFFTFGIIIPLIAYVILTSIDNIDIITNTLSKNPLFDYQEVFDFSSPLPLQQLFLFLFFILPSFSPVIFQRIAMAKDTRQVRRSFIIASIVCVFFMVITNLISVLTLSINPSLNANDVIKAVVFNSSYVGLKGAILAGIMAMIMSTVDSYINSTSVLVIHDFCKPLKIKLIKDELFSARIASILIGIFSLILSLREGSLLELLVITFSLYSPIVDVPFVMAILGFRSTEKAVLLSMAAGLMTVLAWDYILHIEAVNSIPPAMLANLIVLMGSHYLLKQKGGWVGIKDNEPLITIRNERKMKFKKLIHEIKSFNIIDICKTNCPQGDGLISILGVFVMITSFASTHNLANEYQIQYKGLIDILYPFTLCSSSALISYPLWLPSWRKTNLLLGIVWNIIMFFVLICFSFLMVLTSHFSEIQLMAFMINIVMLSSFMTWRWSLFNILIGVSIVTFFYQKYIYIDLQGDLISSQFKIIYLMLLISSALVFFLKPKQEKQKLTEEKNEHLNGRIIDLDTELEKLVTLKHEFLRNLQHESRAPIVGISSLVQVLYESYHKLTEEQRYKYLGEAAQSSERLITFVNNLIDLSQLSSMTYELNKSMVNISELLHERIDACKRMYVNGKNLEFITKIEEDIILNCDRHYIKSTIDNLIINAISYSKEGKITVWLYKKQDVVQFTIEDEGIGIPESELSDIFDAFTVSSKTRTPAGGRGVGLALCQKAIEVHGGDIMAESNGKQGATFIFTLPTNEI